MTWLEFVKKNMSAEMKKAGGSHGKAMKVLGAKWRKLKPKAKPKPKPKPKPKAKAKAKPKAKAHKGHAGKVGPHKGHAKKR